MLDIRKEILKDTQDISYAVLIKSNNSEKQQEIEKHLNLYSFVKVSPYLYVNYTRDLVHTILDVESIIYEVGSLEEIEYAKLIRFTECCDLLNRNVQ